MNTWSVLPDTLTMGLAVCDSRLTTAYARAESRPFNTSIVTVSSLTGAFFIARDRGIGHTACYTGRYDNFEKMLDSTWPRHHDDPIFRDGGPRDSSFCSSEPLDSDRAAAVEPNLGTRPMAVLTRPTAASGSVPTLHEEPAPEANGGKTDPSWKGGDDNCRSIRQLMVSYLARTISADGKVRVDMHVRTCDDCFAEIEALRVQLEYAASEVRDELRHRS
jgi:hypothetical protein